MIQFGKVLVMLIDICLALFRSSYYFVQEEHFRSHFLLVKNMYVSWFLSSPFVTFAFLLQPNKPPKIAFTVKMFHPNSMLQL